MNLFAISGSLRSASYNTGAIKALKTLSPPALTITIGEIKNIPLFNPDLNTDAIPELVQLKEGVGKADGLIIASPEYAHGISGPMKNALDWLVDGHEFPGKPIMLVNTSPRAHHALDSLKEVLETMSGNIVSKSEVEVPLLGSNLNAVGIVSNEFLSKKLQVGLEIFCGEIERIRNTGVD